MYAQSGPGTSTMSVIMPQHASSNSVFMLRLPSSDTTNVGKDRAE